jgi:hypothetical protein
MCGLLPIFGNFFVFYFDLSSDHEGCGITHTCGGQVSGLLWWCVAAPPALRQPIRTCLLSKFGLSTPSVFGRYDLMVNRAFFVLWFVCWLTYLRYLRVREIHFLQEEHHEEHTGKQLLHRRETAIETADHELGEDGHVIHNAIHTGDHDTGDVEQTLLMKWDALVILLHVLLGLLDLFFRMHIGLQRAIFSPTDKVLLFEKFIVTTLSVFSAPFVLWKLPGVGVLVHQMRPTGFDEAGGLRLLMSLSEMKKKHRRATDGGGSIFGERTRKPSRERSGGAPDASAPRKGSIFSCGGSSERAESLV